MDLVGGDTVGGMVLVVSPVGGASPGETVVDVILLVDKLVVA